MSVPPLSWPPGGEPDEPERAAAGADPVDDEPTRAGFVSDAREADGDGEHQRRNNDAGSHGSGDDGCARSDAPGNGGGWEIPVGLAFMPPGAGLAQVLEETPIAGVSGFDTVEVLKAAYRQSCRDRGIFLLALLETGLRRPGSAHTVARVEHPGEFAPEEARAALVWSRSRSDTTFRLALDVHHRLPTLGEAMLAGTLDEPRAVAFTKWTTGLTDTQAAQICAHLIPEAPSLMVGELIDKIKRLAIAIDPEWAERRYRHAVKHRRVAGTRNDDGTANITGYDLPIDRAAAACHRVDTLARACKRSGDKRPIDHIRTDLFLGMLDGTFTHLSDHDIVAHILHHPFTEPTDTATHPGGSSNDPDDDPGGDSAGSPDGDGPGGSTNDSGPRSGSDSGHGGDGGSTASSPPGDGGAAGCLPGDRDRDGSPSQRVDAGTRNSPGGWSVAELRVGLTTLLGWNEHPGELAGWDFVPAALARQIAAQMSSAQWRYAICDDHGSLLHCGITTARPHPPGGAARVPRDPRRGGILELQLTTTELNQLTTAAPGDRTAAPEDRHARWAPVISDLTRHASHTTRPDATHPDTTGPGEVPDTPADSVDDDTRRRTAASQLRRWIQIRDRTCVHPRCRMPAARTDQDHAQEHANGGPTTADNLGSACRHDHRLRHEGGWKLTKPAPDLTLWRSPLGHHYLNRPPPIIPTLPNPIPRLDDYSAEIAVPEHIRPKAKTHPCGCTGACECEPIMPPNPTATLQPPERRPLTTDPATWFNEPDPPPF